MQGSMIFLHFPMLLLCLRHEMSSHYAFDGKMVWHLCLVPSGSNHRIHEKPLLAKSSDLFQRPTELIVVDLHSIIEINFNLLCRQRIEHIAFPCFKLVYRLVELIDLFDGLRLLPLRCRCADTDLL